MNYYYIPKRTQEDILAEKQEKDFADNVQFNQRGLPNHLLLGHGPSLDTFEKRDLATTSYMSYEMKQSAKEITNPMEFKNENAELLKVKGVQEKTEKLKKEEEAQGPGIHLKPRAYNEFTKKIDLNYHKIGLRK